jgi:RNA polymerase-binding transcription factor
MTAMVEHRNNGLRAQLEARLGELQAKLVGELVAEPDANVGGTGEVRDTGDEAVVIEHTGVRAALMARDARELNDLQSALVRIDGGSYGVCTDCGLDIEPARLRALPTAPRCSACQEVFEHRAALTGRS